MHSLLNIKKAIFSIRIIVSLVVLSCIMTSCEKVVHLNLATTPGKLVVEGSIETGLPPTVILTTSIGFSSTIDLGTLENSFVHGAVVTVSDGTKTITLKEYTLDTSGQHTFSIYTVDTATLANLFVGEVNKSYTLTIQYNGTTYTSVTKIPNPKGVDTMWTAPYNLPGNDVPADALQLFVNYTDPDTSGNKVRYYTKRNDETFYPGSEVFSDDLINGTTVKELNIPRGRPTGNDVEGDSTRFFYPGDTIVLKWCAIDKNVFDFWNSFSYASNAAGNPFASPINVHTNISNGGLGVWAGYGVTTRTIVAH